MLNKYRHINTLLLLKKSIFYRIISIGICFCVMYLITKNFFFSFKISLIFELFKTLFYFCFECVFNKIFKVSNEEGFTLWATGPSGVGKSSLMDALEKELRKYNRQVQRLDGDIIRLNLCSDLGFSKKDRDINIKRVAFLANLLSNNGVATLCSFISPYKQIRDYVRANTKNFIEVYLIASKEELIRRDPKGLYKKALNGEIKNLTGYDGEYQESENAEIKINTEIYSVEDSIKIIINYLKHQRLL